MTIKSWKKEFYPVPAYDCPEDQAIEHSLQKWIGLRPENLKKHKVQYLAESGTVIDLNAVNDEDALCIDGESCALCTHHLDHNDTLCEPCPLYEARGGFACDTQTPSEFGKGIDAPYQAMSNEQWQDGTPEPMIYWLEVTLKAKQSETNHEMECGK